jgi:hypothetical protein
MNPLNPKKLRLSKWTAVLALPLLVEVLTS